MLGIAGTFWGISQGMKGLDLASAETAQASIQTLLGSMKTAFVTSLWGMGAALLLTLIFGVSEGLMSGSVQSKRKKFLTKVRMETPALALAQVEAQLYRLSPDTALEAARLQQEAAACLNASAGALETGIAELTRAARALSADAIGASVGKALDRAIGEQLRPTFEAIEHNLAPLGLAADRSAAATEQLVGAAEGLGGSMRALEALLASGQQAQQQALEDARQLVHELGTQAQQARESGEQALEKAMQIARGFHKLTETLRAGFEQAREHIEAGAATVQHTMTQLRADAEREMEAFRQQHSAQMKAFVEQQLAQLHDVLAPQQEALAHAAKAYRESIDTSITQQQSLIEGFSTPLDTLRNTTARLEAMYQQVMGNLTANAAELRQSYERTHRRTLESDRRLEERQVRFFEQADEALDRVLHRIDGHAQALVAAATPVASPHRPRDPFLSGDGA